MEGVSKAKFLKGKYGAKLKVPGRVGWGAEVVKQKKNFRRGGMDIWNHTLKKSGKNPVHGI